MSLLNPEPKISSTLGELGVHMTILVLPPLAREVWSGQMPSFWLNNKHKCIIGNSEYYAFTNYLAQWLSEQKITDLTDDPLGTIHRLFPNLQYAGYEQHHFIFINIEGQSCLTIGIT